MMMGDKQLRMDNIMIMGQYECFGIDKQSSVNHHYDDEQGLLEAKMEVRSTLLMINRTVGGTIDN
ncbi:hypothetical protein KIN20_025887 [Parelaphostrongylus tenuis]|uniref:Uncharacterized protein n=1 Tax=Parelaphostrongylus tenuis TaxID=148309 RepID=A0AAD5N9A3_PARTN|nr:hypothetical protein KIN20_025887 [Parelaphostrongylus tenuis]